MPIDTSLSYELLYTYLFHLHWIDFHLTDLINLLLSSGYCYINWVLYCFCISAFVSVSVDHHHHIAVLLLYQCRLYQTISDCISARHPFNYLCI